MTLFPQATIKIVTEDEQARFREASPNLFRQDDAPTVPETVVVGKLWSDTTTNPAILKVCTSISPVTFTTALIGAATDTSAGIVELATIAEVDTGTDASRVISPDALAGSDHGRAELAIILFESDTAVTTGNGKTGIPVTAKLNGWEIVDFTITVHDKGITGTTDVMLRRRRAGSDVDVLSTAVTLGDEFFASDGVIKTDGSEDIQTGDIFYFDVDTVHSGTAPKGLSAVATARVPT